MIERLGVSTDWAQKSQVAYAKLLRLLDPNPAKDDDDLRSNVPEQSVPNPAPPPVPKAPFRGGGENEGDAPSQDSNSLRRHVL